MAQSFAPATAVTPFGEVPVPAEFYHAPSRRWFRVVQRDGRFFQQRFQRDQAGGEGRFLELEMHYRIGSGNHASSYLHRTQSGELIELPVTWYPQERRWDMSPGYDQPKHQDFQRRINYGCMSCHSARLAIPPDAGDLRAPVVFESDLPSGIDCQRCHGPGARHIELARARTPVISEVRAAIVNPRRLPADRQMDVCLQCHLETTSAPLPHAIRAFGKGHDSFRPGDKLSDHMVHFDHPPEAGRGDKFEVVGAGYRLLQSKCFVASKGRVTCTTCHDPHTPQRGAAARAGFNSRCQSCHQPHADARRDCVSCHMPRRRTEDAVHVVLTDHLIRRDAAPPDFLAPRAENHEFYKGPLRLFVPPTLPEPLRSRYLGVGAITDGADVANGVRLLRQSGTGKAPVEVRSALARGLFRIGLFRESAAEYASLIAAYPKLVFLRIGYAAALEKSSRIEPAIRQMVTLTAERPRAPEPYRVLGNLLIRIGRARDASTALRTALRLDPLSAEAHSNLGNLLLSAGGVEEAVRLLRRSIELDPAFPEAENNLARALAGQGDLKAAIDHLRYAVELDPKYVEARYNLASVLQAAEQLPEAIAEYQVVLRDNPKFVEGWVGLGVALVESGKIPQAVEAFRNALKLDPNHAEARRNLAIALQ